jgi:membrane protein DedA with SNARE-associated domain
VTGPYAEAVTDVAAAYGMGGWPFWAVVAGLFVVVMARSHLFYWLGRGVLGGARRFVHAHDDGADGVAAGPAADVAAVPAADAGAPAAPPRRVDRLLRTPLARRGVALVHRWGPLAVTAAYLTVGVQTAVFVAAGLVRMPYVRFVAASIPGSVAWALVWGTVGLGAVWAAVRLAAASPWALAAALVVAVTAAVVLVVRRRRRARVTA